jgi:hypothetical protein
MLCVKRTPNWAQLRPIWLLRASMAFVVSSIQVSMRCPGSLVRVDPGGLESFTSTWTYVLLRAFCLNGPSSAVVPRA